MFASSVTIPACRHDILNVVKKTSCVEKGRTVDRMIKFPVRQWKQRTVFDLVRRLDSAGSAAKKTAER